MAMAVVALASSNLDLWQGAVSSCIRPLRRRGRSRGAKTAANSPSPLLPPVSSASEPPPKQAKDLCRSWIWLPLLDLSSKKLPFQMGQMGQMGKKDAAVAAAFGIWLKEAWSRHLLPFRLSKSFLVALAVLFLACTAPAGLQSSRTLALTEENLLFLEAWRTIDRAYIDKTFNGKNWFRYREDILRGEPMSTREQTYTAIRKMLATLDDPFTRFLEPEKFKSLKSGTKGAVTGVGLEVGFETSYDGGLANLVVVAPISGGPADRAGIVPGDVIVFIDGENSQGMGLYEAARRLQGPENSKVELTLHSKDATTLRTLTLLREKIVINPVTWHLCQYPMDGMPTQNIGYIRLSTFNQNAAGSVKKAIKELRDAGATAYVLDIRNNSGGLFPAGIEIAKMWLDKGVIVYISDSVGVRDIYETDGDGAISINEPLAVLVNKGTASASEILAGALKDNSRAVILGEPTFGKGKIQSVFELSDGSGMAVTVARYETPAHIDIDKVGITPNRPLPSSFPMDGDQFCQYLAGLSSQHKLLPLFDK